MFKQQFVYTQKQPQQTTPALVDDAPIMVHSNRNAMFKSREYALMCHASQSCTRPFDNGKSCGQCLPCQYVLKTTCMDDGMQDAWHHLFPCDEECPRIRFANVVFIYDYEFPPPTPGHTGSEFIPGVSQALIYHPAPATVTLFGEFASITILTLQEIIDFPTQSSLSSGEFVVYFPFGTGIDDNSANMTTFGLSDIGADDIAVASSSYGGGEVPFTALNSMWMVSSVDAAGNKILRSLSIAMYKQRWLIETDLLLTSESGSVENGTKGVLRIMHINSSINCGFWDLERLSISEIVVLRPIFMRAIIPPCEKLCSACRSGRSSGCGGNRCGKGLLHFSFGPNLSFSNENGRSPFANLPSEIDILEDVLNNRSKNHSGLTIDPESKKMIQGTMSDNLLYCDRDLLKSALEEAIKDADSIKLMDDAIFRREEIGFDAHLLSKQQKERFVQELNYVRAMRVERNNQMERNKNAQIYQQQQQQQQMEMMDEIPVAIESPTSRMSPSSSSGSINQQQQQQGQRMATNNATKIERLKEMANNRPAVGIVPKGKRRGGQMISSIPVASSSIFDGNIYTGSINQ